MLDLLFETRSNPEDPSVPLSELDAADWGGSSGVSVESAMGLSAVYSCIGVLGRSMGQLPLHVMRRDAKGVVSRATDHPVYYLLHDEPNPFQTSYDWRESGMVHVSGWGNHYTEIVRHPRSGEVRELGLIRPWESNLVKTNSGRHTYAVTADDARARAVSPEDMIHIKAIGSDGKVGKSPITQCREAFALGLETQGYGNQFFRSGGKPTGIVSVKSQLEKSSWERLLERWRKSKAEMQSNDNKTLFLPSELAYQSITIPPEDAQFLETRKFSRSEVAGIYNVPAHMINDLEKATFSNISEQAIQFVRHTMIPWVVKWEQELNRKLFTEQERRAGYYVKFNLNGLLRGTAQERAEFYSKAIRDGWMTRNQVRELEDMNQADGLDTYLLSADLQTKEAKPNE
ncbi:phage portal protein (plasmid) [Vibrio alginolyticus]|uniref:phage portal protein n=2 Tax=Vibrio alginolyticus TaxID=663 RepID=UPI001C3E713E|nr:phage portal protein [Vibrio alginolyticus]URR30153.1 phage portal protein [Vibrio alginolyticus]